MPVIITMFYAGLLGLVFLALSLQVVRLRRSFGVGLGSGGHDALGRAIRAHANFAEYVPLALVLVMLVEAGTAAAAWVVHVLGLALFVGRLLHGFAGVNRRAGESFGRFWGTALTWLVIAIAAVIVIASASGRWLL